MIRLLASLGLILAMVVTMDRVLASSLGAAFLQSGDRFLSIYKPDQSAGGEAGVQAADVLILGNSRADNHFPTSAVQEMTCWSAVNLGMGGAPTTVSNLLFQDYVERHGAPRLLVLEPTSVVDEPMALADLPLLSYYSPRVDGFIRQADFSMWAGNQAFNLLIFNNNQTIRMGFDMLRGKKDDRTLHGTISDVQRRDIDRLPMEKMEGFQPNWDALNSIIRTAHEHGTKVAVVITPYYPGYIQKVSNFEEFFDDLKRRLPPEVAVIDARRVVKGDQNFMDPLHVNAEGVQDMFHKIENELRPLGNCPMDAIAQLGNGGTGSVTQTVSAQP
ncbi:hypothetical protein [Azospirillum sp. SYSU D00513]|uniref:hypothetical protein n=1 Tax=Azospirillum sp. SYSU D00513 TaxID=2812561 RepID=UPI001A975A25|nr:hypothetical protein [Azospirillum sp. SYSU D00513]